MPITNPLRRTLRLLYATAPNVARSTEHHGRHLTRPDAQVIFPSKRMVCAYAPVIMQLLLASHHSGTSATAVYGSNGSVEHRNN